MNTKHKQLFEELAGMISEQQKGQQNKPAFMVGEQLKEIAQNEAAACELLVQDLKVKEMDLTAAAAKLKEYADKNHGNAREFCITPLVAEGILRKFYGLPERGETATVSEPQDSDFIDLGDFM